jgi:hypothetical protein
MRASVAFILLDLFLVVVCWKKRKQNKTKQTSNPSSLFSHLQLGPTVLPGPASLSPLFPPALPKAGREPDLLLQPNSQRQPASPSPSLPLADTAAPRQAVSYLPPLVADPLLRRLSLPSELPGESPLASSSFRCLPRRDWWPGGPVWPAPVSPPTRSRRAPPRPPPPAAYRCRPPSDQARTAWIIWSPGSIRPSNGQLRPSAATLQKQPCTL